MNASLPIGHLAAVFTALIAGPALAQVESIFHRTIIVDPKQGAPADFQTIQGAINEIISEREFVTDEYTVFIHAGIYDETIALNENGENINLVGVDRDFVIIRPTDDGAGIKITSGTETERNNRIANLTIDTTDSTNGGHGINIVKGGTPVPKNITIEGVTIRTDGLDKHGIEGAAAEDVRIFDCDIDAGDAMGIHVGSRFQIISSRVENQSSRDEIGAIRLLGAKTQIKIENCFVRGGRSGITSFISFEDVSSNVQVVNSEVLGAKRGVYLRHAGPGWLLHNCRIRAENVNREGMPIDVSTGHENVLHAVNLHMAVPPDVEVVLQSCRIAGIAREVESGISPGVVTGMRNSSFFNCRVFECDVSAAAWIGAATNVYGIDCPSAGVVVEGGRVQSVHFESDGVTAFDEGIEVFDLHDGTTGDVNIFVNGTTFTKWKGPIGAAGTPGTVTQTTTKVSPASDTAVHDPIPLTQSEQEIETDITDPDVNRVLSITRSHTDIVGDVYLIGTNRGGEPIVEKISFEQLAPELTVAGQRPFKTVTKIIVPGYTGSGENREISVGTTDVIGLYYPIADEEDVLQFARKADGAGSYTIESFETGAVDVIFSTFNIQSVVADDSFEWRIQTGQ